MTAALAKTADRLARRWLASRDRAPPRPSWDDLRAWCDTATGGDLDCQPLDILTDLVLARVGPHCAADASWWGR